MQYVNRFGHVRFGGTDERPDYSDLSWFVMLFSCGLGIGMFFSSVAEPVYHYTTRNRYTADPTLPDNTVAQIALNLLFYHYGTVWY